MKSWTLRQGDPGWPDGLADLPDAPHFLRCAGEMPSFSRAVAIVGTRHADEEATEFAFDLAADLARADCTIVSGGARGIDVAAHRGALSAGGTTVVIQAGGLRHLYPSAHVPLFDTIAAGRGLLMSEVDDDTPPTKGRFLARNRLIAAMGKVTVVVQAPSRSGALSTAAQATKLKRPLFAVPSSPWDPRGSGCVTLLQRGAKICTSARDVLSVTVPGGVQPPRSGSDASGKLNKIEGLEGDERTLGQALSLRPRHTDELVRATGLPVLRVQQAIVTLLLAGHAVERGAGWYARSSK